MPRAHRRPIKFECPGGEPGSWYFLKDDSNRQPGLRTSGLNDAWVHEKSVDLFQVSRDPHAPRPSEATDVGRAVEDVGTEDGVSNPTWAEDTVLGLLGSPDGN